MKFILSLFKAPVVDKETYLDVLRQKRMEELKEIRDWRLSFLRSQYQQAATDRNDAALWHIRKLRNQLLMLEETFDLKKYTLPHQIMNAVPEYLFEHYIYKRDIMNREGSDKFYSMA